MLCDKSLSLGKKHPDNSNQLMEPLKCSFLRIGNGERCFLEPDVVDFICIKYDIFKKII